MMIDVPQEVLIGAALFMGGQIVTLAGVVRSNRDQGRRLGEIDKKLAAQEAVRADRRRRLTNPIGNEIEDTPV